jgi:nucleotide-binding universal stress UspA family protein
VDTRHIQQETGIGGSIGAMHYAERVRRRMQDTARTMARSLTDAFVAAVQDAHLPHEKYITDGVPFERIVEELMFHDLLVIGRDPHFFYNRPDRRTDTLAKVVKQGTAPAVIVGDAFQPIRRALIACDGSGPSVRTLQRFVQLQPFGSDLVLDLVFIRSDDREENRQFADYLLTRTRAYVAAHGFADPHCQHLNGGSTAERLLQLAEETQADLIVAGAHSVSAVRRVAFGSTTHALLRDSTVPLFLHH